MHAYDVFISILSARTKVTRLTRTPTAISSIATSQCISNLNPFPSLRLPNRLMAPYWVRVQLDTASGAFSLRDKRSGNGYTALLCPS